MRDLCPAGSRAGVRLGVTLALVVLFLFVPATFAGPAEGSLRLSKNATTLMLTWGADDGPYGIYRTPDPADTLRPARLVGATGETHYEEELAATTRSMLFYVVDDPLPCFLDSDCDNHEFCDGAETCNEVEFSCAAGAPVLCNDGDSCTTDTCDESVGACVYESEDCDDGNPCTLDSCHTLSGCTHSVDPAAGIGIASDLAGRSLPAFPDFEFNRSFNQGTDVELGVDPFVNPELTGDTCDVYILSARSAEEWCADTSLSDTRGAPETVTFPGGNIGDNSFVLDASNTLSADAGTRIGVGYDLVIDCNQNGFLDSGELADGLADEAGFFVVHDLTTAGPLSVSQFDDIGPEPEHCSGGGNDDMRVYYPADLDDPGFEGQFPLVVISHGNGHCFDWYDFLGTHLASYGYIVMSHDNDTGPGIETASTTTLQFTDKILLEQDTLGSGVLNGHIDATQIAWIGHSRGGEGVVRAYDRIVDEGYPTSAFSADDIIVISSIAPTDFLGPDKSDPHDVPYHLLYGSADGDVCGCPGSPVTQSFSVYERASGFRQSTYIHGADHNDFNCCGFNDFTGPADTEIGRDEAQQVQKAALLSLLKFYLENQVAAHDYLWRQYETLRPIGVAADTVVVSELRNGPALRNHVVDDYQTNTDLLTSSSGGSVDRDVDNLVEDLLQEPNSSYDWSDSDPMNGMARGRSADTSRGAVFDFSAGSDSFYEFTVIPEEQDFSDDRFLSFRACQGTRHPLTMTVLEDLTFTVTLIDTQGHNSGIGIGSYGGGIEEPYQRGGYGSDAGWQNEFETIRIRMLDFLRNGSELDLEHIETIRFDFGSTFGSAEGRIAIDDIEVTKE